MFELVFSQSTFLGTGRIPPINTNGGNINSKNLKTVLSSIRNLDSHFSTSEVLTPCIYLSFKTELFQEITFVAHEKFKNTYKVYSLFFKPLLTPLSFMCVCRIGSVQKY